MSAFDTNRVMALGGFAGLISKTVSALRDWNDARVTRNLLARLSDRELDDIGLCRADIDWVAQRG